jgi:signal transduction histidine kinase
LPWYALACATTLLNAAVFGILGARERKPALKRWALGWLAWGLAVPLLVVLGTPDKPPLAAVACGLAWVISTLLFLDGTHRMLEARLPRAWLWLAAVDVLVAVGLGVGPDGQAGMLPLVLFQSLGLAAAGVVLLRRNRVHLGGWLAGPALVALGLHVLDAPLLARSPAWFVWGFVVAIVLQLLAALGVLALHYELTRAELGQTQRVLEQARRIEALGRIAAGVAHDFNNILTVLQGNLDLLSSRTELGTASSEPLSVMSQAIARGARLTRQLLAFGKRSQLEQHPTDVSQVVKSTLDLLRQVVPSNIELRFTCSEESLVATLDQALLEQIVLNLVTNARDAISGPGQVHVVLTRGAEPEAQLLLEVTDDGVGMDEQHLERIFEPFFTSKPHGRGTGLGLVAVQDAVAQLKGRISVRSRVGQGTTFSVQLPTPALLSSRPPEPSAPDSPPLAILVVDDDASVRQVTARMLELGGHRVDQADDGQAALERLGQRRYDLVVSDVSMPRMGGIELHRQLTERQPHLAVLLTAGEPLDHSQLNVALLAKPYGPGQLLATVAKLTPARRASNGQS